MDRKAVAKELRQKLFDFIEAERRDALQDEAIDRLFEDVLAKHEEPKPFYSLPELGTVSISVKPDGSYTWVTGSDMA